MTPKDFGCAVGGALLMVGMSVAVLVVVSAFGAAQLVGYLFTIPSKVMR